MTDSEYSKILAAIAKDINLYVVVNFMSLNISPADEMFINKTKVIIYAFVYHL